MARITRVPYNSRQYIAYPVLLGVVDTSEASVDVAISPVGRWGESPELVWFPAEFSADESGNTTVQALTGIETNFELEPGLYKVRWRISSGAESTIVAGDRYLEIYL